MFLADRHHYYLKRTRINHLHIAKAVSDCTFTIFIGLHGTLPLLMSDFLVTDSAPAGMAANVPGGVASGGGPLLQCTDDRSAALAGWPVGGSHNSALSTPTLWQYPGKYTWWMTQPFSLARPVCAGAIFRRVLEKGPVTCGYYCFGCRNLAVCDVQLFCGRNVERSARMRCDHCRLEWSFSSENGCKSRWMAVLCRVTCR